MRLNVEQEVAALRRMTVDELREKYREVFQQTTRSRHKEWLVKRIAWRMQANAEGDLSERARRRALELANDADLRVTAPRAIQPPHTVTTAITPRADARLPMPGAMLTRDYRGRTIRVLVLPKGFEYEGEVYRSPNHGGPGNCGMKSTCCDTASGDATMGDR